MELSEEQLAHKRKIGADRVRRWRHAKRDAAEIATREAWEQSDRRKIRDQLWWFAETEPRVDAQTHAEELAVTREWARALEIPDVTESETLRAFAKRVFIAWGKMEGSNNGYRAGFNRAIQRFDNDNGFIVDFNFDEFWLPPADCLGDEPIDVVNLPPLSPLPWIAEQLRLRKNPPPPLPPAKPPMQPPAVVPSAPSLSEQLSSAIADFQQRQGLPEAAEKYLNGGG